MPEYNLIPIEPNVCICSHCGLKLEDVSQHLIDADALDHIKEKHPDVIVDMINDIFSEVEEDDP